MIGAIEHPSSHSKEDTGHAANKSQIAFPGNGNVYPKRLSRDHSSCRSSKIRCFATRKRGRLDQFWGPMMERKSDLPCKKRCKLVTQNETFWAKCSAYKRRLYFDGASSIIDQFMWVDFNLIRSTCTSILTGEAWFRKR